MTDEQKAKCHEIAEYYPYKHQIIKCMEEMAELTQLMAKVVNDDLRPTKIVDELADVQIMIEQMDYYMGCMAWFDDDNNEHCIDMDEKRQAKLNRQLERMEREENG